MGEFTMKRIIYVLLMVALLAPASLLALQNGGYCIHISNDLNATDTVVAGRVNTLEIWIENDALLTAILMEFEFDLGANIIVWEDELTRTTNEPPTPGADGWPDIFDHGRALGDAPDGTCWTFGGFGFANLYADGTGIEALALGGMAWPDGGFEPGPLELAYTLRFEVVSADTGSQVCTYPTDVPPAQIQYFYDAYGNYVPDYCGQEYDGNNPVEEPSFFVVVEISWVEGDANRDGNINITDAVYLLQFIFAGGSPPHPHLAGDANCSGVVNITDVVYIIAWIFCGGPPPIDCGYN